MRSHIMPAVQMCREVAEDGIGDPPPLTKIEKPTRSTPSPPAENASCSSVVSSSAGTAKSIKYDAAESGHCHPVAYSTSADIKQHQHQGKATSAVRAMLKHQLNAVPYAVAAAPAQPWVHGYSSAAPVKPFVPCTGSWAVNVSQPASIFWSAQGAAVRPTQVIQTYPPTTERSYHPAVAAGQVIYPTPHLVAMPPRAVFVAVQGQDERQTHSPDSGFNSDCGDSNQPISFEDGFSTSKARQLQSQVTNDPLAHRLPSGQTAYACQPCQMSFIWRRHLEQHFLVHRTQDKQALCHICGKCFTRADHLNRHCATHDVSELTCQLCGATFHRASHLDKHWRTVHPHGQIAPRERVLSTASGDSSSTSDDSRSATSAPPQTPSPQVTRRELSRESFLSQLLRPVNAAAVLPEGVDRMVGMRRGVRGAPNLPRRFGCSICGRRFARSAHLHRHQRIHTGEKPFRCFQCGRSYARGDYLRAHLTMQHNQTVLDCEVCCKPFSTISALNEHQRTEHGRMRAWYLLPGASASPDKRTRITSRAEDDDEENQSGADSEVDVTDHFSDDEGEPIEVVDELSHN